MGTALHDILASRQSDDELKRKAAKARRRDGAWTIEELDATSREAELLMKSIQWE